jgi:CheY-like chemotaxis protein
LRPVTWSAGSVLAAHVLRELSIIRKDSGSGCPYQPLLGTWDDRFQMITTLLLVDDDAGFRALATDILREIGVESIVEADTAAAAVDRALVVRPQAALVDVGLPDRDGIELARELAALPWAPAIVLTSADCDVGAGIAHDHDGTPPFVPKDELLNVPLRQMLRLE